MKTHGMYRTPEYHSWDAMIQRCVNSKHRDYHHYGARGISVCDAWKNSFQAFYQDMGARPSEKHSIDRVNNNGNYEPGNCRWATKDIQNINQRIRKDNKSGFKGVIWHKTNQKWQSYIKYNGEQIYIGYFSDPREAAIARDEYIIVNELSEYVLQVLPEP